MTIPNAKEQKSYTPEQVLTRLKAGNRRFVTGSLLIRDHIQDSSTAAAQGQHPLAFILGCIDSRSIANLLFDEGIGSLFVARVAGNIINEDIIASMEYAVLHSGVKLIVIMGHSQCGAITAACQNVKSTEALNQLLQRLESVVQSVENLGQAKDIESVSAQNVRNQISAVLANSSKLSELVKKGEIAVVGAMHELATGEVHFY